MAQWVNRARTDGGASIQITWRMAGRWRSGTFTDARARQLVVAAHANHPELMGWSYCTKTMICL